MKIQKRSVSGMFVFLLLGLFAVVAVLMVLLSAGTYRSMVDRTGSSNDTRTLNSFVRSTLMADDAAGIVEIREEKGIQTLCIRTDGGTTIKRLYCLDGTLRELYTFAENEFEPDTGEIICEALDMTAVNENGMLTVTLTDRQGRATDMQMTLRTWMK